MIALRRVIHRDVKNENIVVDLVSGQCKLIDFGAATYLKTTKYHGFQGTRLYCPPEWLVFLLNLIALFFSRFLHRVYMGLEATVWSLGIVLHSMLNGQLPFANEDDICTKSVASKLANYSNGNNAFKDFFKKRMFRRGRSINPMSSL
jgi:serine/threonine protein kinase